MFKLEEFAGKIVLTSSMLKDEGLVAFFTTRDLPLKAGEREDLVDEIKNNKKLVCEELQIPQENLIIPQQTHSDNIVVAKCKVQSAKCYENTDALVTNEPNIALALNFADCVPILFYDPVKKIIAGAHAGWRGTAAQIGPKTIQKMIEEFSCEPSDIIAAIGPAIGKCCFEAKEDVLAQLEESISTMDAGGLVNPPYANDSLAPYPLAANPLLGKERAVEGRVSAKPIERRARNSGEGYNSNAISNTHADLKLINKLQLLACGIEKIDVCEYCTSCQNELFFSYRREQGNTARHSAVIMMKNKE